MSLSRFLDPNMGCFARARKPSMRFAGAVSYWRFGFLRRSEKTDHGNEAPDTLIDVAKASEDARTHGLAMAGFLDNFYTLPDRRQAMIDPKPPLTG